jgi:glycosyltransferase involved in cell wall biosynthesis
MARFNFILPFLPTKPVGGVKNLFQFANRLAARGHEITILCAVKRPFKKQRTPVWFRLWMNRIKINQVKWFQLDHSIKLVVVPEITDKYVPDAQATLSTWWQMAYALPGLSPSKGTKINFVQDYELWTGQEDRVHESYKLPVTHVVIAKYLQELIFRHSGVEPVLVNTPIDTGKFFSTKEIGARHPASVLMMFSEEPRKGSMFGIAALNKVKALIPELEVTFFSVYDRPANLPVAYHFHRRPQNLVELYNAHAIFLAPSLGEGWALPPAEAMACGCAVVCTEIGGHQDYAIHQQTAILVPAKDVERMASAITELIRNKSLRERIATNGHEMITQSFNWDHAVQSLEHILTSSDQN